MTEASRVALAEALKARAISEGFSLAGIASAEPSEHTSFFRGWLEAERHGRMAYLARPDTVERRADLRATLADVRSCLVVAHEYGSGDGPDVHDDPARAVIARYARGDDYHDIVLAKLERLREWVDGRVDGGVRGRSYVDTGPILERELARRAGLGWFGRNTMLIHPERGSYFFLGVLLLEVELPIDLPFTEDRCGTCRACLDACPTGALLGRDENGAPVIDARRCISYLTIELRGPIPVELRPGIGNRVFGCDICQEACPWNERFGRPSAEPGYTARGSLDGPPLTALAEQLLDLDEAGFRSEFRRAPVLRAKREGLLRNVCIALGNWGADGALAPLERALDDASPLVRAHAAWALGRLGSQEAGEALLARLGVEGDPDVIGELEAALGLGKLG
ncbi:MAG: tRNA epoxyqueuosine(34) reductase QueG [Longimicrobiales bacterium]